MVRLKRRYRYRVWGLKSILYICKCREEDRTPLGWWHGVWEKSIDIVFCWLSWYSSSSSSSSHLASLFSLLWLAGVLISPTLYGRSPHITSSSSILFPILLPSFPPFFPFHSLLHFFSSPLSLLSPGFLCSTMHIDFTHILVHRCKDVRYLFWLLYFSIESGLSCDLCVCVSIKWTMWYSALDCQLPLTLGTRSWT